MVSVAIFDNLLMLEVFFCVAEPFLVGFVQTSYTVLESAGSVEVCVQLTRPLTDVLDETVTVHVINDPTSAHIPSGATLAGELEKELT